MKKIIIFLVMVFIMFAAHSKSYSEVKAALDTKQKLTAYHPEAEGNKCYGEGTECLVVTVVDPILVPGTISQINPGGRSLEFTIDDVEEYNTSTDNSFQPFYSDGISKSYYTFPVGTKLRITEAPEDPTLLGLEFNISGYTTDNNGKFQIYIPF